MSIFDNLFEKQEAEKYKTLKEMNKEEPVQDLDFKTDLNKREIRLTTTLEILNTIIKHEFDFDMEYDKIVRMFEKKQVSLNRKGRTESIDVMKSDNPFGNQSQQRNMLNRFLGTR